jgi:hypothetical protein
MTTRDRYLSQISFSHQPRPTTYDEWLASLSDTQLKVIRRWLTEEDAVGSWALGRVGGYYHPSETLDYEGAQENLRHVHRYIAQRLGDT